MIKSIITVIPILLISFSVLFCGGEKTPSRDHIPLIKERLSRVQEGIKNRDTASIDSVLSVEILKNHQSSDSLLKFVYGDQGRFSFESFGQPVIIYTDKVAKVEALIFDSSHQAERPVILTFIFDDDQWLLSKFESDTSKGDSD